MSVLVLFVCPFMGFLLLLNPDRNLRVVRGLVFLLFTSCRKLTVYKSTVCTSRGWQQGPESATNEDTLDSLVVHGLNNHVYLPVIKFSSITMPYSSGLLLSH